MDRKRLNTGDEPITYLGAKENNFRLGRRGESLSYSSGKKRGQASLYLQWRNEGTR